jgi:glycosyltransferase involved in cell wall biosynthesis
MVISVIIPARNEERYIAPTLRSFYNQPSYERIVVANGCSSDDDTANIAHDLGAKVLEMEKGNTSMARNTGAASAEGDVLIFNDADTLVAPNYLESTADSIARGYDFGGAWFKPQNNHPVTWLYCFLTWGSCFVFGDAGGNMYVRKSLFDKSGGFNADLVVGEDTDLSRRMKNLGGRYKFLHSTHVITSMRKFEERGPTKELFVNQLWPYVKTWL